MPGAEHLDERPALEAPNRALLTVGVMMAMIVVMLDTTVANVALPHMQAGLGATFDTVTWVLTSYIIGTAVAMPITGWLADRIGSRRLFLLAVGGFVVTSMACGIATHLEEMVLFRFIQGIAGAFIGPLSQTVMLDINVPSRQARAMSVWGMGIMIGPIMGPIIGGWLTENYNWRWVFYVNLPVGLIAFSLIWLFLPGKPLLRRNFDLFGFSVLAIALSALQLMLDRGTDQDWFQSTEIWIEAIVAASAAWVFIIHLLTKQRAIIDRTLIANGNMSMALLFQLVIGLMMMAVMALMPPLLQRIYGYDVLDTGVLLAPRGVGILFSMFLTGRIVGKVDPRYIIMTGMLIAAVSMWQMTRWTIIMGWQPIVISGVFQGLGMGLCFMPVNSMAFATLDPRFRTEGASLLNLFRSIGGSVGISIVTAVLGHNVQTSHEDLAAHITSSSLPTIDPSTAERFGGLGEAAMTMVNAEVSRQALMIAYLDDFKLIMYVLLATLPVILIMKPPKHAGFQPRQAAAESAAH